MGIGSEQTLSCTWSKDRVQPKCPGVHQCRDHDATQGQPHKVLAETQGCPLAWHCPVAMGVGGDADLEALHQDPHSVSNAGSRRGHRDFRALGSNCKGRE